MNLYEKIDALSGARDLPEVVKMIQDVLRQMTYYVVNSEGAILEQHEDWHDEYAKRLRRETRDARPDVAHESALAPRKSRTKMPPPSSSSSAGCADDKLPPSLQALMGRKHRYDFDSDSD